MPRRAGALVLPHCDCEDRRARSDRKLARVRPTWCLCRIQRVAPNGASVVSAQQEPTESRRECRVPRMPDADSVARRALTTATVGPFLVAAMAFAALLAAADCQHCEADISPLYRHSGTT